MATKYYSSSEAFEWRMVNKKLSYLISALWMNLINNDVVRQTLNKNELRRLCSSYDGVINDKNPLIKLCV